MTADALTIAPTRAELWVAYHRKAFLAAAPVALGGLNVLRDAATTEDGINASSVVLAVLAAAQLVATYYPENARAKLSASAVMAVGSGVTAAVTSGISSYSTFLVLSQFLAWAAAGVTVNGARPDIAATEPVPPTGSTYFGDDGVPPAGR